MSIDQRRIVEYEDNQRIPIHDWFALNGYSKGRTPPAQTQVIGTVNAVVNHGRWIVRCPVSGCNNAVIVSPRERVFWDWECDSGWYDVLFPPEKVAIERLLLRRPTRNRNWEPWEQVNDLQRQNRTNGLDGT